ncbi:MAG: hypothetical protein Tsb005_19700 [Gammaproteobacteria bacterium]
MAREELIQTHQIIAEEQETFLTLGARLQKAREKMKLSRDEIARKLFLTTPIIKSIEECNFKLLPEPVFIRGYLRSYAKLVGLPPDELIAEFNQIKIKREKRQLPKQELCRPQVTSKDRPVRWLTYFIVVGMVVLVALWWHGHSGVPIVGVGHVTAETSSVVNNDSVNNNDSPGDAENKVLNLELPLSSNSTNTSAYDIAKIKPNGSDALITTTPNQTTTTDSIENPLLLRKSEE